MFTGIVEEIGIVKKFEVRRHLLTLSVYASKVLSGTKTGDSIAIDGVCLTVVKKGRGILTFEAMKETLETTTLKDFSAGRKVNLERALSANSRFGGHFITGHVDQRGIVKQILKGKNYRELVFNVDKNLRKYIVRKGSICLNGVSLTVGRVLKDGFSVYLIPFTLKQTNLGILKPGDGINIEVDLIARYIL